jgi:DNA-directed RNA polymerase subunit E'/Rpb7
MLGNLSKGVDECLNAMVMKYHPQINGVVLAYKKVELKDEKGVVLTDKPFVHVHISFVALAFVPQIGSIVRAEVIRVSSDHLSCLIFDTFNLSVQRRDRGEPYSFDPHVFEWVLSDSSSMEEHVQKKRKKEKKHALSIARIAVGTVLDVRISRYVHPVGWL